MTLNPKFKVQWKHIKIASIFLSCVILLTTIIVVAVNWNAITESIGSSTISAAFLASIGVNFLSLFNIGYGIVLKIIQTKIERKKTKAINQTTNFFRHVYKIANEGSISDNNKVKLILKELDNVLSNTDSQKSQ